MRSATSKGGSSRFRRHAIKQHANGCYVYEESNAWMTYLPMFLPPPGSQNAPQSSPSPVPVA
ncbi:hypothetical protein DH86_00001324 [Scytalidium sp. 3C]|nr:hypothetical protein DH86_00001324 [Scytalidium sp. 3C]